MNRSDVFFFGASSILVGTGHRKRRNERDGREIPKIWTFRRKYSPIHGIRETSCGAPRYDVPVLKAFTHTQFDLFVMKKKIGNFKIATVREGTWPRILYTPHGISDRKISIEPAGDVTRDAKE